jgi:protein gp37
MLGVSVGHPDWKYRIDWLRKRNVETKFVSFEPLVHPIESVDLGGVDWAIIGGESGENHRPMEKEWVLSLIETCHNQDVSVFFKQHSDTQTEARQTIDGKRIEEFPDMPNGVLPKPQRH